MKRVLKKVSLFIIIFIFVLFFFKSINFAGDILDPGYYKPGQLQYSDADEIFSKGAIILKILRNIAAIVSVVVISIIGIRYMVGSVEQKAEYKQTMIPVVIGCVLVAGLSVILMIIQSIF